MTPEEMDSIMQTANIQGQVGQSAQASAAAQYYVQEQERGLAETQLEVESILEKIYHLLRQDVLRPNRENNGKLEWYSLKNSKEKALSNWGVDRIMQVINFYINKNTLLSNFDEKQINRLMLRFCLEMNDLILLKYQMLFKETTFEECKEILQARIEEKVNLRNYAIEVLGRKPTEEEKRGIEKEMLFEIEGRIEQEIKKIREEQRKEKIREYGLLMAQLESIVYSTYNRAWKGEERGSMRRHTNISEVFGDRMNAPRNNEGGIFKWTKR